MDTSTMSTTSDAMGQSSSSHAHPGGRKKHNNTTVPNSDSPRERNGSITTNGCTGGVVSAKGFLRRASSLSGTPTSKLRSMRSPFSKRKGSKRNGQLSATFTAPNAINVETLDINSATEEQLMTLPGIDRRLAQNVVEYRGRIGGRFQKIDDLAVVSGMGAARLDKIRSEVCVRRVSRPVPTTTVGQSSLNGSMSSRTPSIDSVSTGNAPQMDLLSTSSTMPRLGRLNINRASVFDLQQLPGLNQELAAKIVEYRTSSTRRHLGFKTVDHLLKVKGISSNRLAMIRPFVTVEVSEDSVSFNSFSSTPLKTSTLQHNNNHHPSRLPSSAMNFSFDGVDGESAPPTPGPLTSSHRKSVSVPMRMNYKLVNGYKNAPVDDIFELLGAYSHRPVVAEDFRYERNGNRAIRVASWNLDRMSMAKADNPGVLEVICRTILENKLSIISVQEVTDVKALARICDELNEPSLKRVAEWRENALQWKYVADENCREGRINGLGFIYDNHQCRFLPKLSQEIDLSLAGCKTTETSPSSYLGVFELEDWTLTVLNLYLRYFNLNRTSEIVERLQVSLQDAPIDFENVYLVVGDFTGLVEGASEIEATQTYRPTKGQVTNGEVVAMNGNAKLKWTVNGGDEEAEADNEEDLNNPLMTVEDILNDFQYSQLFEANTTSFVDLAHGQEIDDGLNVSHAPPKNLKKSSCNILCRDKLPPVRDAFREAIYRTKSPLDLRKVPSVRESEEKQKMWRTEKLTGHSNVIREGLCHMAIPRDWTWGGPASDHCPVWIECYKKVEKEAVQVNGGRVVKELGQAVMSLTEAMNGVTLGMSGDSPGGMSNGGMVKNGNKRHQKKLSSSSGVVVSNGNGGRSLDLVVDHQVEVEHGLRPVQ